MVSKAIKKYLNEDDLGRLTGRLIGFGLHKLGIGIRKPTRGAVPTNTTRGRNQRPHSSTNDTIAPQHKQTVDTDATTEPQPKPIPPIAQSEKIAKPPKSPKVAKPAKAYYDSNKDKDIADNQSPTHISYRIGSDKNPTWKQTKEVFRGKQEAAVYAKKMAAMGMTTRVESVEGDTTGTRLRRGEVTTEEVSSPARLERKKLIVKQLKDTKLQSYISQYGADAMKFINRDAEKILGEAKEKIQVKTRAQKTKENREKYPWRYINSAQRAFNKQLNQKKKRWDQGFGWGEEKQLHSFSAFLNDQLQ